MLKVGDSYLVVMKVTRKTSKLVIWKAWRSLIIWEQRGHVN